MSSTIVHNYSFSLIDNIFTNKLNGDIINGNVISEIADHFTQSILYCAPSYSNW